MFANLENEWPFSLQSIAEESRSPNQPEKAGNLAASSPNLAEQD
jgi:hypothetical protein